MTAFAKIPSEIAATGIFNTGPCGVNVGEAQLRSLPFAFEAPFYAKPARNRTAQLLQRRSNPGAAQVGLWLRFAFGAGSEDDWNTTQT